MAKLREDEKVTWSSVAVDRRLRDRRNGIDRRQVQGRAITVPDMRTGMDRRGEGETKRRVRLTITGRAMEM